MRLREFKSSPKLKSLRERFREITNFRERIQRFGKSSHKTSRCQKLEHPGIKKLENL